MNKDHRTICLAGNLADLSVQHIESILAHCTDLTDVFKASLSDLQTMGLTANQARRLQAVSQSSIEQAWHWSQAQNRQIITYTDADYPSLLKQIHRPPPLLYVQGNVSLLNNRQLAIVGTRRPTPSGRKTAYHFADYLAQSSWVITSGLAFGIDIAAHRGALNVGSSIAVLATGLDIIYPSSHKKEANQLAQNGLLVSEMPLGTPPKQRHFPRRNRLISGLSQGVLVVEATVQSGSLHTAHFAVEQNREVFAMPGSINSPQSKGCHALIKQGAKLVESTDDIVNEWQGQLDLWSPAYVDNTQADPHLTVDDSQLSSQQKLILQTLKAQPLTLDELCLQTQSGYSQLVSDLLQLELQGLAQSVPGGYVRC